MPTESFTSSAAAVASANAAFAVAATFTASANAVAAPATWPRVQNVLGSPLQGFPFFDVPSGWPVPALPTP